jgi:uncharacterized protein YndB with AHSA1/START domain
MSTNSLRKEVVVEASAERAFQVFTKNFDSWWPREHHIGKAPMKEAIMESRVKGRWYEVGTDGSESDWGQVMVWDPPRRLVLAWQINGKWQYDPALITEVEVIFTPIGAAKTRVELEHRNLDRFGELKETILNAFNSPDGWNGLLQRFGKEAAGVKV